ncbi:hypothetical protein LTR66_011811 [Elasticomyces elasticus]|nr:hypothetical protein LTR66_011811 [Elasticomyces elasticus]KAK5010610.1 hypothetical protein LTR28_008750 [Elasticomyces elasticus]
MSSTPPGPSIASSQLLPRSLRHPFFSLPIELVLMIVDMLPPLDFIKFAFANYPLLRHFGLAPALSPTTVRYLATRTEKLLLSPNLPLPAELMLEVLRNLRKPIDVMRFVVANYQDLVRHNIAPRLTPETLRPIRMSQFLDRGNVEGLVEAVIKARL